MILYTHAIYILFQPKFHSGQMLQACTCDEYEICKKTKSMKNLRTDLQVRITRIQKLPGNMLSIAYGFLGFSGLNF